MGAYEYQALDARGRRKKGVLEGDTPRQARQKLREQGLTPLSVEAVIRKDRQQNSRRGGSARRMGATELALLTRQLATLTQSGLPLETALNTVSEQSENKRTRGVVLAVRSRVMEGHSLAAGMAEFPGVFSDLYRATVAAGEQSGYLGLVLERLADYTEQRQQLRSKVQMALFYPAILTVMAIVVTVGLMVYVVPDVVQVFAESGQQLPALTTGLIAASDFLQAQGLLVLLALLSLAMLAGYLMRVQRIRYAVHRLSLRLPVLGRMVRAINAGRFLRTLSILTASGVPILDALRIAAQVLTNLPMREAVEVAATRVREGSTLNAALHKHGLFPPMAIQLIASGEAGGNLDDMLERAAINQEREIETTISALLALFEPVLILVMGVVVLLIVLALLLPILNINQLVK